MFVKCKTVHFTNVLFWAATVFKSLKLSEKLNIFHLTYYTIIYSDI